jgi:hypothetical protein
VQKELLKSKSLRTAAQEVVGGSPGRAAAAEQLSADPIEQAMQCARTHSGSYVTDFC